MGQICVVLDTHIFLKGLPALTEALSDPASDSPDEKALKHTVDVCHLIAINDDILKEYVQIAPRHQISPLFIRDKIAELKRIGKIIRKGK